MPCAKWLSDQRRLVRVIVGKKSPIGYIQVIMKKFWSENTVAKNWISHAFMRKEF